MFRIATLVTAVIILAAGAQAAILVEPAQPTTADTVRITASGGMPVPCYDVASTVSVDGRRISIAVELRPQPGMCIQVISCWSVAHEVGPLPAGVYDVVLDVVGLPGAWPSQHEETAFLVESPSAASSDAACAGDCSHDGRVEVAELVVAVRIALGELGAEQCPAFAGAVDIGALVEAVENALHGCGGDSARTCTLDPLRSGIDFGVGLRLPVAVVRIGFSGTLTLRTREPRGDDLPPALEGTIPVTVTADDLRIDPIRIPGVACLCVRAAEHAPFGPRVAGVGSIDCGEAPGSAHLGLLLSQAALDDAGLCSQAGPHPGGGCPYADYGPDCLPCTDDDAGMSESLLLALSTTPPAGAPFDCAALEADPNGGLSGGVLAAEVHPPSGGATTIAFGCE